VKLRSIVAALGVALMVTGLVSTAAAPASAHTSGYCGHGTSGSLDLTHFVRHQNDSFFPYKHWHLQDHRMFWSGDQHFKWVVCYH
jgi:hypothetical protein